MEGRSELRESNWKDIQNRKEVQGDRACGEYGYKRLRRKDDGTGGVMSWGKLSGNNEKKLNGTGGSKISRYWTLQSYSL